MKFPLVNPGDNAFKALTDANRHNAINKLLNKEQPPIPGYGLDEYGLNAGVGMCVNDTDRDIEAYTLCVITGLAHTISTNKIGSTYTTNVNNFDSFSVGTGRFRYKIKEASDVSLDSVYEKVFIITQEFLRAKPAEGPVPCVPGIMFGQSIMRVANVPGYGPEGTNGYVPRIVDTNTYSYYKSGALAAYGGPIKTIVRDVGIVQGIPVPYTYDVVLITNNNPCIYAFKTPNVAIPGGTGAVCERQYTQFQPTGTLTYVPSGIDASVYNPSSGEIGADKIIWAHATDGKLIAFWEDCNA